MNRRKPQPRNDQPAPDPNTIAGVVLREKAKSCGKPNCNACPHGGFWYAYIPAGPKQGRAEVYLGREINNQKLLAVISPKLIGPARQAFTAEINRRLDAEKLQGLESDWQSVGGQLERLEVDYNAGIKRLQHLKNKIEGEMTTIRARLNGKRP